MDTPAVLPNTVVGDNTSVLSSKEDIKPKHYNEQEKLCEIEASVCSGLEAMAKEEILEKLGGEVSTNRGRANMLIPVELVTKVCSLLSKFL